MRRISFALTTAQVLAQTKTVTRRFGWVMLQPGDRLQPIEKGMGLKKGETQTLLGGPIEVIDVRRERLNQISVADMPREGFPDWEPPQFVEFLCKKHRCQPDAVVTRIEFRYVLD